MNFDQALADFTADKPLHEARGVILPNATAYLPDEFRRDYRNFEIAMDAQPLLQTTPNAGIPSFLTTLIDPAVYKILFAPNNASKIINEVRKGTWLDKTAMFPTIEHTGEVTSYGDFNEGGRASANESFPQRQGYLFQTMKEYGELEMETAGLGKINWVSEVDAAAALVLTKYHNLTYFFGISGLQNYGLLNDPSLSASLTPSTKAAGGTKWIVNGAPNASANEVYADIQAIYIQLITQTSGLINQETPMVLAMSPSSQAALNTTNSFGLNVYKLLGENFPNIRFEQAVQYGALTATNPQGIAAGNLVQLIAENIEGQETGYCAYNEKMRAHKIIPATSSFKQKVTGGSWGAVIRMPIGIASMVGV